VSDRGTPGDDDLRALAAYITELGGSPEEIEQAAQLHSLGPLALDLALRPPGPSVSFETFLAQTHIDPGEVRRLWSALGLPESPRMPFPVTPDIARAIEALAFVTPHLGEESVLGLARVIGSSVARIAEALATVTRVGVEIPQIETGVAYADVARNYSSIAQELLPVLWDAIGAIFRRHLVLVSYGRWSTDDERIAVTVERTIGFVDLVGSTEVLRSVSVSETAALVNLFEQIVWDVVSASGGRVVKLIGDEAMFVVDDPSDACRLALALLEASPQPLRVGLAEGPAVALHGDYYGPVVNLAARLVAVAPPSAVIVSDTVREHGSSDLAFEPFETGSMRGFADVTTAFRVADTGSLPSSR
jgi:class 3 adenylate cyclase